MLNFEVVCRYASTFRAYGRCLRAYLPAEVVDGVAACKGGIVRIHDNDTATITLENKTVNENIGTTTYQFTLSGEVQDLSLIHI